MTTDDVVAAATEVTDAVMEDLRGRKGIFDDIDQPTQDEIHGEIYGKVEEIMSSYASDE